mgnify:CR=1 FL=1
MANTTEDINLFYVSHPGRYNMPIRPKEQEVQALRNDGRFIAERRER